jgi:DNA-directed RNA polymerase beta subunit
MPIAENGKKAEVILSALGVNNRLNSAQLVEYELNFISDKIAERALTIPKMSDRAKFVFDYIRTVNQEQFKALFTYFQNLEAAEKKAFLDDMLANGIHLHQPPFWNNVAFDELRAIYKKYDWIEPYTCTMGGKPIMKKLIIAPLYLMKLNFSFL